MWELEVFGNTRDKSLKLHYPEYNNFISSIGTSYNLACGAMIKSYDELILALIV